MDEEKDAVKKKKKKTQNEPKIRKSDLKIFVEQIEKLELNRDTEEEKTIPYEQKLEILDYLMQNGLLQGIKLNKAKTKDIFEHHEKICKYL